ncbi:MAG: IS3 family transposase [Sedimentisphaerales bacterium]
MHNWSDKTEISAPRLVGWIGISRSKYYDWRKRYGEVNEHNALVPRDYWLDDREVEAIVNFQQEHPLAGYRRLTYMMIDADVVAVSPSSVYRVLRKHDLLARWNRSPSKKGTGFVQPTAPHKHWHVDITYVNVCGTFLYLCSLLDGFSRYIVHWEIREKMTECDVETIIQRARETFPRARPRIISDNGPQFIAKDFKQFIRQCGMTHVRTSPYYPQSNGKLERWHGTLKTECIRPGTPLSLDDARRIVGRYVRDYNTQRLHSAIDYIAPKDKLEGRAEAILTGREAKLAAAREQRRVKRQQDRLSQALKNRKEVAIIPSAGETEARLAGEQLARDNRSGGDGHPSGGVGPTGSPHPSCGSARQGCSELPPCLLKLRLAEGKSSLILEPELSNSR